MTKEKINLGSAFEDFKKMVGDHPATTQLIIGLKRSYDKVMDGTGESYAEGFGVLASSVKRFLCATTEANIYDIDKMLTSGSLPSNDKTQGEILP